MVDMWQAVFGPSSGGSSCASSHSRSDGLVSVVSVVRVGMVGMVVNTNKMR